MAVNVFLPQVTRIPVSGPEPYNTLVCVEARGMGSIEVRKGKLYSKVPGIAITPFILAGFDQRVPPLFQHSTTAWMSSVGPFMNGNWLVAVDSITGAGFDPVNGQYFVTYNYGILPSKEAKETCIALGFITMCFYYFTVQVTSYVLCYEPEPIYSKGYEKFSHAYFTPKPTLSLHTSLTATLSENLKMPVSIGMPEDTKDCSCK